MREPQLTGAMMEARGVYRRWLSKEYDRITLAGLAPDDQPLLLRKIYVPLVLTPERVPETADEKEIQAGGGTLEEWLQKLDSPAALRRELWDMGRSESKPFDLGVAPDREHRTLLVSGEPGSGKTTLTQSVVASLSGSVLDPFNRVFKGYVPIPLTLRSVPPEHLGDLEALVDWWLGRVEPLPGERWQPEELRRCLDEGWGIFLFDGLDELVGTERRRRFLGALRGHRWLTGEEGNFAVLTGRPPGYQGMEEHLPPGLPLHVAPFSRQQIRTYLERWFDLRPMRTAGREGAAEALLERLTEGDQQRRLLLLARRPAYLAALAFVHGTRGQLPHTRAELYELLVDAYLEVLDQKKDQDRWSEQDQGAEGEAVTDRARNWNRQDKLQVLSTVAFIAHREGTVAVAEERRKAPPKQKKRDLRFQWSKEDLIATVRLAIEDCQLREIVPKDAAELTDYFVARTGLLADPREGVYQFAHLSLQEYLAALYLLDRAAEGEEEGFTKAEFLEAALLDDLLEGEGWHEVAMLVLAIDAGRSQNVGHRALLQRLEPGSVAHCELLTRVLEGEEVRLAEGERGEWVAAWFGMAALRGGWDVDRLARRVWGEERNRAGFEAAWGAVAAAVAKDEALRGAPGEALWEAGRGGETGDAAPVRNERSRAVLLKTPKRPGGSGADSGEPLLRRVGREVDADPDPAAAVALVLPLYVGGRPDGAAERLRAIAENRPLFGAEPGETGTREPLAVWWSLVAWSDRLDELVHPLAMASRFPWLTVDEVLLDRVVTLPAEGAPGRPRELRRRAAVRERLRLVVSGRVLAVGVGDRERSLFAPLREEASGFFQALAPAPALARAPAPARALAPARARALARDLDLAPALARESSSRRRLESSIGRLETLLRSKAAGRPQEERAARLLSSVLTALAVRQRLGNPESLSRAELLAELDRFADPERAVAGLEGEERRRAVEEHRELLECPWSPLPMIEAVREDDGWEELDVSEGAIVGNFVRRVEEVAEEVGDGE